MWISTQKHLVWNSKTRFPFCAKTRCQFHQHFTRGFFCTKILPKAFLNLHLRFELLLAQEYWCKCAHKMLVKLTNDGGFIVRTRYLKNCLRPKDITTTQTLFLPSKNGHIILFFLLPSLNSITHTHTHTHTITLSYTHTHIIFISFFLSFFLSLAH